MGIDVTNDLQSYVDVRVASARSGLPQECIIQASEWEVDPPHSEVGDTPVIRSSIGADGVRRVYLGDVLTMAGGLADSDIKLTIRPRRGGSS